MNPCQEVLCAQRINRSAVNYPWITKNHPIPVSFWFGFHRIVSLLTAVYLGLIIPSLVWAADLTVFGPETLLRVTGKPVIVERIINISNPWVSHTLQITNGGLQEDSTTAEFVSSAEIFLNGVLIAGPQNFNQNIQNISVPVILQTSNTLTVELRGKPGGQLAIAIVRDQNQRPTADSGPDQTVYVGDTAQLVGNGSTDIDGDPLTFFWQLIEIPTQSQSLLSDPTTINPTLFIDSAGRYSLDLVVNDGFEDSVADRVIIDTLNSAPIADAGPNQTAFVDSTVILDGSASSDADDDFLSYQWRLTEQPTGSQSVLMNTASTIAELAIDRPGHYIAELTVNDDALDSAPDQVAIDTVNSAPIASAGLDQAAFVGDEVELDGIDSYDVDGDNLSYHWSLLNKPVDSAVTLLDADAEQSRFTPDVVGQYIAQLFVQDPDLASIPETTTVTVTVAPINHNPVILSTPNTTTTTGEAYSYAVNAEDQDGDSLNYRLAASPANMSIDNLGQLTWTPLIAATHAVMIEVTDGQGGQVQQSFFLIVTDPQTDSLPPDPETVAPKLNPTEYTSLADSTAFLYNGDNPIQTGVTTGTIEVNRVAIVRGQVRNENNQPLTGVTINIQNHPEFGQTLSRADGVFDLAVNGGGLLTINYTKAGYLPVQRQVQTPWSDYAYADDVIMIPLDDKATLIDLSNNTAAFQVAQGSVSTDVDGSRQATVLFPQGITATMTLPDGTTQALSRMTVRATEYTVGDSGPKRMPGPLPPASGYTYAVELSVDEALAAGAETVVFNRKVPVYVDNFLNFPVGEVVPVGYYDQSKAAWIPSENGRVVKIVSITNGLADLDVTGDDIIDADAMLTTLGITEEEQAQLAILYNAGNSLWRVQINHLTPWDMNWPYGPPADAEFPPDVEPKTDEDEQPDDPCEEAGCVIQIENQVLGEDFPITGSEMSLHYRSNRVPGRTTGKTLTIPLSGKSIPASLIGIKLTINVAGQTIVEEYPAQPLQSKIFSWDGRDVFGREVSQAIVNIKIEYIYPVHYYAARDDYIASFAIPGYSEGSFIGNRFSATISISRRWKKTLFSEQYSIPSTGLGGLTLSTHHALGNYLILGSGGKNKPTFSNTRIAGINYRFDGDYSTKVGRPEFEPSPGIETVLDRGAKISVDSNGNIFIGNTYGDAGILTQDGLISNADLAGGEDSPESFFYDVPKAKMGTDGSLYNIQGRTFFEIVKDGRTYGDTGNTFFGIHDFDLAEDNSVYFPHSNRIYKISPNGNRTIFAGNGEYPSSHEDGLLAINSAISPYDIKTGPDGAIFFAERENHCVRKIDATGIIQTVAGECGIKGFSGDGDLATKALLNFPSAIILDQQGNLFISDTRNARIRKVTPDGNIVTFLGDGNYQFDTVSHIGEFSIGQPGDIELSADGELLFITSYSINGNSRFSFTNLLKVGKYGLSTNNLGVAKDGKEFYRFDNVGRHLETRDTLTNQLIYRFTYETNGYLSTITDTNDNVTKIERLADGMPVAIITSDDERTDITLNAEGYVKSLTNPASETHRLTYLAGGLLDTYIDPNGNVYDYDYDAEGRLIDDKSPVGAGWELEITEQTKNSRTVTKTSKEGRVTTYRSETLPTTEFKRTITNQDGTITASLENAYGETIISQANGTVTGLLEGPDPRFGMQAPIPKITTITLPGGLFSITTFTRNVTLSDPQDLLSLTQQTETLTQNGKTSISVYDAASQTITNTSAQGRTGSVLLDAKGRPIESLISGLNPVYTEYDSRGRMQRSYTGSDAELRETLYSYYEMGSMKGYLHTVTDALGQTSGFEYDLSGRITRQTLPDLRQIHFVYDANGNVTRLIPAGRPAHDFEYDGLDQETRYLPPDLIEVSNPITTYSYNKDRQLTLITRPDGNTITPVYNLITGKLDRLITAQGQNHYAYHAATGRFNHITTADNQQLDFTYDGFLLTGTTWAGDINGSVNPAYNSDFNLSSRSINGAHSISYRYDNDQLLIQAGALSLTREAQKGGLLNGTVLGLQATTQSYTAFAELQTNFASYDGTEQIRHQYGYDKLSRIKNKTETIANISHGYEYSYDASGRLESVKKDTVVIETYGYDSNNNRTHKNGAEIATYDAQDRLLTYNGNSYTYTANGELKSKTNSGVTTKYSYDTLGNLKQVTLPGDITIDYIIDGQNRRIGKKVNGQLKQGLLYKDQLNPIAELNANNVVITRFVYAEKEHVPSYLVKIDPTTQTETTYRIISDHLGSPRLIVNTENGSIAQQINYDTWGNVTQDTNPGFQPFGFAGGLYDPHTRLVRFGARDYDAETGRWTAKDPIRFAGGDSNLYGYVVNDPVNFVDPSGLICVYCIALDSGGNGYKDGVKQCIYSCKTDDGRQAEINAPGRDLSGGDVCYGAKFHDQYIPSTGDFTNMTDSLDAFKVDTESFWDQFRYPGELIESINKAFPEKNR